MGKLTLSVNDRVVVRAKKYAKQRGTSVSQIVETFLDAVVAPPAASTSNTPVLNSLRGILNKGDQDEYKQHLTRKYR